MKLTKKILIAIAGFVILLILLVQSPVIGGRLSYLPVYLMPAAIAAAVMMIGAFIFDIFKKTRYGLNFLLLLIVLLGAFWGGLKIVDMQINSTKNTSETIITATDKYFADNGRYPETLDQLSPKYLNEIPKSKMGIIRTDFYYISQDNASDYRLGFQELFNIKWIYIKSHDGWMMDDKSE